MDPLTAHSAVQQSAVVTLDVLHTGVIWGWFVTMNFWAKSVATGAVLLAPFFWRRFPERQGFYRLWAPLLGFVFICVTLLFTVLDLHQPLRFWHMIVHPHSTSLISLGSWVLNAFTGLTLLLAFLAWTQRDALYNKLYGLTWVVAFFATIYTAGLLGQASARELWSTATELPQMLLAALIAGSAAYLLSPVPAAEERRLFGWILAGSALVSLSIFGAEIWFAPMKSEEAEYTIHLLVSGQLKGLFLSGLLIAFVLPAILSAVGVRSKSNLPLTLAAVCGLVGLFMVKHAWLLAPQLLPLS